MLACFSRCKMFHVLEKKDWQTVRVGNTCSMAEQRITERIERGETKLWLANLRLTSLPSRLGPGLLELNVSDNGLTPTTLLGPPIEWSRESHFLCTRDVRLAARARGILLGARGMPVLCEDVWRHVIFPFLIEGEGPRIGEFESLTKLDCSLNPLGELPKEIRLLTNLKELVCWSCQLTELPEWLGVLTKLEHLNCSQSRLTALPESLGALTNLKELLCGGNRLTELPESLGALVNLKVLNCGGPFFSGNKLRLQRRLQGGQRRALDLLMRQF